MDGGAWWAAVHGVMKSQTRLSNFTFTFHFHALEKEMATHSSVLAWRIPGTAEPGGLLSMGSHRVGPHRLKRLSSSNSSCSVTPWTVACQAPLSMVSLGPFRSGVRIIIRMDCSLRGTCFYFFLESHMEAKKWNRGKSRVPGSV